MTVSLEKIYSGKVRDLYAVDERRMLMVASDRLSAFDVIFRETVPGKGEILTQMSNAWFDFFGDTIPNQFTGDNVFDVLPAAEALPIARRAVVVKRLTPLKIEAVARGYLAGGGWREYKETGTIGGRQLPAGLQPAQQLPEVLFTPATKAAAGDHDENITFARAAAIVGQESAEKVRAATLNLYRQAAAYALQRGIIIADSKFEFGLDADGVLTLMDEVLTPDCSRFWAVKDYRVGVEPPSYDKQVVRRYLQDSGWDKTPPPPALPPALIRRTRELYAEIFLLLFGK